MNHVFNDVLNPDFDSVLGGLDGVVCRVVMCHRKHRGTVIKPNYSPTCSNWTLVLNMCFPCSCSSSFIIIYSFCIPSWLTEVTYFRLPSPGRYFLYGNESRLFLRYMLKTVSLFLISRYTFKIVCVRRIQMQ